MKKRLYVHIGRAKTGTTVLQTFLKRNMAIFNQNGFEYAKTGLYYINHQPLAWTLFKIAHDQGNGHYWGHAQNYAVLDRDPEKYWQDLRNEIETGPFENYIISAEEFGVEWDLKVTTPLFKEFTKGFDVKIIIYVRRQDDFLQSLYNEAVKGKHHRFSKGFWDYVNPILEHGGADCLKSIEPWAKVVGKENVIVRVYEKAQMPKGIFYDFMQAIGLDLTDEYKIPERNLNPRLSAWGIRLLRFLNRFKGLSEYHNSILKKLQTIASEKSLYGSHSLLSDDDRREILKRFEDSNRVVAHEYLGRKDGKLFLSI